MRISGRFLCLGFFCAASILLFGVLYVTGGAGVDFDLDAYQWKNRIILVFAPYADSDAYERQMRAFEGQEDGILDRDLIILELFEKGESRLGDRSLSERVAPQMRRQFDVGKGEFVFILIGKDGTVKRRSPVPVSVSDIFSMVDAMPMRQQEMRRKHNGIR
ncbi:MAG: DUF4174 domain-containing protein [Desulfobacteraceae bacterium]|jgi:hypothetical protein